MKRDFLSAYIILFIVSIAITVKADDTYALYTQSSKSNKALNKANNKITQAKSSILTNTVDKCSPAIVGINVTEVRQVRSRSRYKDPVFNFFYGGGSRKQIVEGLGSGYIISPEGYIITNHHVAGNASKIVITMTNGKKYRAKIIGADAVTDVCLLKIEGKGEKFPFLRLGNSDNSQIGEWVLAFGNPFGLFDINTKPTVTVGIVSNKGVSFTENDNKTKRIYKDMIQTDAAISSGNSGGPLVNALGEVIGMNTVIWSTSQSSQGSGSIGIGFAIPINTIINVIEILKRDGRINRDFYLGMAVRDMDKRIADYLNTENIESVVVFEFSRVSPAKNSGLQLGDIIIAINDYKIHSKEQYQIATGIAMTGDTLTFTIKRKGRIIDVQLLLKKWKKRR